MSWQLREDPVAGVTRPSEHRGRGRESGRVRPGALRGSHKEGGQLGAGRAWGGGGQQGWLRVRGRRGVTSFSQNLELDGEGTRTDLRK